MTEFISQTEDPAGTGDARLTAEAEEVLRLKTLKSQGVMMTAGKPMEW